MLDVLSDLNQGILRIKDAPKKKYRQISLI